MEIAIVILNWNGKKLLEQFLPSISAFCNVENTTIYVADNASTDSSVQYIQQHFPSIQIIQNKSNGGYAKGYNDALQHVTADIYCLVNSDIEVTENWLPSIIKTFKNQPNTAIIQPKILAYKNKLYFEYAGAGGGFIDKYGYPFCRGRLFSTIEKDEDQYNNEIEIFWASGACFFIRAKVFHELHGFDEDYFAHQEEIDLCWRAKNLGYAIKYIGTSKVYHIGGATLKEESRHKTYLNFRNSLFSLVKNLPKNKIFPIIFMRLILDGIAAAKFLTEFKFKHIVAILKAHVSFYKNLNKMLQKRSKKTAMTSYFLTKSIVFNYFIKRIKTFNELISKY